MRRETFRVDGDVSFELVTGSGDVEVLPGGDDQIVVELEGGPEATYIVELTGSELVVRPPTKRSGKRRFAGTDIKVQIPANSFGTVRTASGDVLVTADLEALTVATASGDLRVTAAISTDVDVKTASGDVKLSAVGRNVSVSTASGDVSLGDIEGDLQFNSASGDMRAQTVEGIIELNAVSGDLAVAAAAGDTVKARTLSGDVRLGIPPARTVDLDMQTLSGEVINRLNKPSTQTDRPRSLSISVKTVSGNLKLESS